MLSHLFISILLQKCLPGIFLYFQKTIIITENDIVFMGSQYYTIIALLSFYAVWHSSSLLFQVYYKCLQPETKHKCIHKSFLKWEQHHLRFPSEIQVEKCSDEGGFRGGFGGSNQHCFDLYNSENIGTFLLRDLFMVRQTVETAYYNKHHVD